jgi:hypothetical protein
MTRYPTARAKILQVPGRGDDRRPANTGMTETLDGMFDKLRDAAAAHDDD